MAEYAVSFRVYLDSEDAEKSLSRLEKEIKKVSKGRVSDVGIKNLSQQTQRAAKQVGALDGAFATLKNTVAAIFAGAAINSIIQTADAVTNLKNQLKLVIDDGADVNTLLAEMANIANEAGQDIDAVGRLYAKLSRNAKALGLSQQQLQRITALTAKSLSISGATATEASAAILQFSQALGSGVLRGDEFNSLMENAPRLMQALAEGLNQPIGALRGLAEQGLLTADIVVSALQSQANAIDREFAKTNDTVGRALTRLKNQWALAINELNQDLNITGNVADLVNLLADNLPAALRMATLAAGAFAGVMAGRVLVSIVEVTKAAKNAQMALLAMSAVNPLTLLAAAAGAAGVALYQFNNELDRAQARIDDLASVGIDINEGNIDEVKKKLTALIEEQKRLKAEVERLPSGTFDAFVKGRSLDDAIRGEQAREQLQKVTSAIQQAKTYLEKYGDAVVKAGEDTKKLEAATKLARQEFEAFAAKFATKQDKMRADIAKLDELATKAGVSKDSEQYKQLLERIKAKYQTADAIKKAVETQTRIAVAQYKASAQVQLIQLHAQEQALEQSYKNREITTQQYYQRKEEIINQQFAVERALIQKQIEINKQKLTTGGDVDRVQARIQLIQLEAQLQQQNVEHAQALKAVEADRLNQQLQLINQVKQAGLKFKPQADSAEAVAKLQELKQRLLELGNTKVAAQVEVLINKEQAKAEFEQLQTEFNQKLKEFRAKQEQIQQGVDTGATIDVVAAADQQALAEQYLPQLEELKQKMQEVGQAFLPPEQLQQKVAEFQTATEGVKTATTALADAISAKFADGITNEMQKLINGTQSWGQTFRNIATMILQEIQRMILKMLVMKAIQASLGGLGLPVGGFAHGGYTGDGGKYEPAGIVHRGEFVFTKEAVRNLGLGFLYSLHNTATNRTTNIRRSVSSYADGGLVNPPAQSAQAVNIMNVLDPSLVTSALATVDGEQAIINAIGNNSEQVKSLLI